MPTRHIIAGIGGTIVLAGIAYAASDNPIDFRVYFLGARGLLDGSRPVYGEYSGMGWPLHYRYPPLFLFLFAPLTFLPLRVGAAAWLIAKVVVLALLVHAVWRRLGPSKSPWHVVIPILIVTPYVLLDFRYGNVQMFIVALVGAALLQSETHPLRAAFSLALAISIKVWPLFFVPYLIARRNYRVAWASLATVAALTMLPVPFLGLARTMDLTGEWAEQELVTQAGEVTMWFPSQSLGGVATRYLTLVDYSEVPDPNYPAVNVANLRPNDVRTVSFVIVGLVYAAFLVATSRQHRTSIVLPGALAFCLVALLEPHTQRHALVLLVWPALAAGRIDSWGSRALIVAATGIAALQPLLPGAGTQRLFQTLGADFLAVALLAMAIVGAFRKWRAKGPNVSAKLETAEART